MEIESQLLPISNITLSIRKKICQNIYRIPGEVANFFGSSNVSSFMIPYIFVPFFDEIIHQVTYWIVYVNSFRFKFFSSSLMKFVILFFNLG
jgi:hypothetical protein